MKLKFLQLLDNLVKNISTKFGGIWIYTLESARKVTFIGLIKSHFDWKVLKLEICLQVFEVPKFGFGLI